MTVRLKVGISSDCFDVLRDLILYNKNCTSLPWSNLKSVAFLVSRNFFPDSAPCAAEWYNNHIIIYPLPPPFISARRGSRAASYALTSVRERMEQFHWCDHGDHITFHSNYDLHHDHDVVRMTVDFDQVERKRCSYENNWKSNIAVFIDWTNRTNALLIWIKCHYNAAKIAACFSNLLLHYSWFGTETPFQLMVFSNYLDLLIYSDDQF